MAQEIADSKLIDTWSSDGLKVKPDISKIIEGWQLGEQPPHEYMNWLQNTFGSKLNHVLKNGVASWNNTTQYLAGATVQHNSNVWLCKVTNTNSAPTDANVNWKRIITVESLTTVLGGYVALTGDQTIAGVKTFTSNIITPSTSLETNNNIVATADYVRNKARLLQTRKLVTRAQDTNYTNTGLLPITIIINNTSDYGVVSRIVFSINGSVIGGNAARVNVSPTTNYASVIFDVLPGEAWSYTAAGTSTQVLEIS